MVLDRLGDGISGLGTIWHRLPEGHGHPLVGPYTATFLGAYVVVKLFEYNGGMWNLAQRYMATDTPQAARRSAGLSALLYVIWPAVLLFPPVAAAVLLPDITDPQKVYALMAESYLPAGLVGLTLAGMFSHTMAMASSDANAVSAVVTRDIIPAVVRRAKELPPATGLFIARVCTVVFITVSMLVAIEADHFGGVLGIIVGLVAAVMGPISIPMLLGLLPLFRKCGPRAALSSWALGLLGYVLVKFVLESTDQTVIIVTPLVTSLVVYVVVGLLSPEPDATADAIVAAVSPAPDGDNEPVAVAVPQAAVPGASD